MCGVPLARATRTRVRRRGPRGLQTPDFAPRVLGDGTLREPFAVVTTRGEGGAGEMRAEIKQKYLAVRGRESLYDLLATTACVIQSVVLSCQPASVGQAL